MFEEDAKRTEAAIFSEIKDSAQLYQKSCSEDSHYTYKVTSCVRLDDVDSEEPDEEDTDADEADADEQDADSTDADTSDTADDDTPDETDATSTTGSDQNNGSQGDNDQNSSQGSNANSGISQSTAQSQAQSYMDDHVSDDGNKYSMSYAGKKNFDGIDYYSYSVTKTDQDGNSSYVTNIYVDSATGNDVWDEAD